MEKYGSDISDPHVGNVGDRVRLREIPPWVQELAIQDIQKIYQYALGRTFQVARIDDTGKLELWIYPPENPLGEQVDVLHVEPEYVDRVSTTGIP